MKRINLTLLLTISIAACLPGVAGADPRPGRDVLKFSQEPMINTPIPFPGAIERFNGHDELSTAWGVPTATGIHNYQGTFMADDFADRFNSPVVHLKWWGSYLNRPTNIPDPTIRRFLISFESDIPASPAGGFSRPGEPLLNQIVSFDPTDGLFPSPGTFKERLVWPTSFDGPIYEYNAELHLDKAFEQKANTVYWLKIVALDEIASNTIPLDQRLQWGWHNRDYTKMDPLASTIVDGVIPGERPQGFLPVPGGEIPIWHFQDDAVSGFVNVEIVPSNPIMPFVVQTGFEPQKYFPPWDGPSVIGQYSKDLAFQLFTVPEPSGICIAIVAMIGGAMVGRRRS